MTGEPLLIEDWLKELVPWLKFDHDGRPPSGFILEETPGVATRVKLTEARNGLQVVLTAQKRDDGKRWVHLSLSRGPFPPMRGDIINAKEALLGPDIRALEMMEVREMRKKMDRKVVHLFHCLDDDGLPDFC